MIRDEIPTPAYSIKIERSTKGARVRETEGLDAPSLRATIDTRNLGAKRLTRH